MHTVLIIDDNAPTRDILRQALERAGREVVEASDGRGGIARQRTMPAAVIITDILMPDQEGFETIRELRRDFPTTRASLLCLEEAREAVRPCSPLLSA